MKLSDKIRYFFAIHSNFKKFFKPLYKVLYKNWAAKKDIKVFHENALNVLKAFDECMNEANVNYVLAFGTMLGAVREKGFIKHDYDIDVMVWSDEYSSAMTKILEKRGFKLTRQILVEEGKLGREETYQLDSTSIDVFYVYPPVDEHPYVCIFTSFPPYPTFESSMEKLGKVLAHRVECPVKREREYVSFESLELPIPTNSDQFLRYYYGDDYMIPNPNWTMAQYDRHIVDWIEVKAVYRTF